MDIRKHLNVNIIQEHNKYRIINLLSVGNAGVYKILNCEPVTTYYIYINGEIQLNGNYDMVFYYQEGEKIEKQRHLLINNKNNQIEFRYTNPTNALKVLKIGILFSGSKISDYMILNQFNIIKENSVDRVKKYKLSDFFNNIFIINLKRRPDRLDKVKKRLSKYNINYEIIEAIDGRDIKITQIFNDLKKNKLTKLNTLGELGCIMSHIKAIKLAKERNYKNILILEDDILINKNIESMLWKINTVPSGWELLYLGCSHLYGTVDYNLLKYSNYYRVKKDTYGTFAYVLSQTVYDIMINKLSEYRIPADTCLETIIERYNSYAIYEYIFLADLSESDIRKEVRKTKPGWTIENYE